MEVISMSAELSINSVTANPADVNPQVKADQAAAAPQAGKDAQKTVQAAKTDTVIISQQAVQKLASDGDTAAQEAHEKASEKASETVRGKA
jgi:hypothetical protein